jgi:hypothetical protein
MIKLQASAFDVLTNQLSVRELTEEEIAAFEAKAIAKAERIAQAEAEAEAKAAQKAALLNRLGITEEEAKLLLA